MKINEMEQAAAVLCADPGRLSSQTSDRPGQKAKNLEAMENFCHRLLAQAGSLQTLPVNLLLTEMDEMEKGGAKFMDIRKKDKRKRKQWAATAAGCDVFFMAWLLAIIVWGLSAEKGVPILLVVFTVAIPLVVIAGTLIALIERLKEIEGGEIDEASKY